MRSSRLPQAPFWGRVCAGRGGLQLQGVSWTECQEGDLVRFESTLDWSGEGLHWEVMPATAGDVLERVPREEFNQI